VALAGDSPRQWRAGWPWKRAEKSWRPTCSSLICEDAGATRSAPGPGCQAARHPNAHTVATFAYRARRRTMRVGSVRLGIGCHAPSSRCAPGDGHGAEHEHALRTCTDRIGYVRPASNNTPTAGSRVSLSRGLGFIHHGVGIRCMVQRRRRRQWSCSLTTAPPTLRLATVESAVPLVTKPGEDLQALRECVMGLTCGSRRMIDYD